MQNLLWIVLAAWLAQSAPEGGPKFEVASIRPHTGANRGMTFNAPPSGRFTTDNIPLRFLIRLAYSVNDFQISGGPAWIQVDGYDVIAKAEGAATIQQMRPMIQAMLADRFKLVFHRETKELPVYELLPAKSGLKLAVATEGGGGMRMGMGYIDGSAIHMPAFISNLSNIVGRSVIDKTGFTGVFDVHLEFSPDEAAAGSAFGQEEIGRPAPPADPKRPSIFNALQEQLGLRLQSAKGPVEMLVIDQVEKLSEN
jgi:bla regulator protein blaR1